MLSIVGKSLSRHLLHYGKSSTVDKILLAKSKVRYSATLSAYKTSTSMAQYPSSPVVRKISNSFESSAFEEDAKTSYKNLIQNVQIKIKETDAEINKTKRYIQVYKLLPVFTIYAWLILPVCTAALFQNVSPFLYIVLVIPYACMSLYMYFL